MRLERISWKKAEEYFKTHDIAVIPVGSIENHGSHLALGTDFMVPSKIAEQIDRETDVLILPAVPYGVADSHMGFAGTISLGYDGLLLVMRRICNQLYGYGVRRFVFLNGHGGNDGVLQEVGIELNEKGAIAAIVNWWQLAGEINPDWKGGHGGGEETAAMMAIGDDLVDTSQMCDNNLQHLTENLKTTGFGSINFKGFDIITRRSVRKMSDNGWIGIDHPTTATKEWGQKMLEGCAQYALDFIEEYKKVQL